MNETETIKVATTLQIPKSVSPKTSRTIRDVYNETIIASPILKYRNSVFLAILLLSVDDMLYFANVIFSQLP